MSQVCKRVGCGRTFNRDVNPNVSKYHGYCCFECFKACEPEEAEKAVKESEMMDKAILGIALAILAAVGTALFYGFKWLAKTRKENPALYNKALIGILIVISLMAFGIRGCAEKAADAQNAQMASIAAAEKARADKEAQTKQRYKCHQFQEELLAKRPDEKVGEVVDCPYGGKITFSAIPSTASYHEWDSALRIYCLTKCSMHGALGDDSRSEHAYQFDDERNILICEDFAKNGNTTLGKAVRGVIHLTEMSTLFSATTVPSGKNGESFIVDPYTDDVTSTIRISIDDAKYREWTGRVIETLSPFAVETKRDFLKEKKQGRMDFVDAERGHSLHVITDSNEMTGKMLVFKDSEWNDMCIALVPTKFVVTATLVGRNGNRSKKRFTGRALMHNGRFSSGRIYKFFDGDSGMGSGADSIEIPVKWSSDEAPEDPVRVDVLAFIRGEFHDGDSPEAILKGSSPEPMPAGRLDASGEPESVSSTRPEAQPKTESATKPTTAATPTPKPAEKEPSETEVAAKLKTESISEQRMTTLEKAADQAAERVRTGKLSPETTYQRIRASSAMTDSEKAMFFDMLAKRGILENMPSSSTVDASATAEAKRLAEEAEKKRLAEETEKKRLAEEEAKRKAEEAQRKRKEEFDRKQKLAEEKRKKMLEEARKKNEEAARLAKEREEQEKKAREEETRKKQDEANARLEALRQQALKAAEKREDEEEEEEEDVGGGVGIDRRMLESAGMGRSRATVLNDAEGLREVAEAETRRREAMRRNEEERSKFQADYLRRQTERDAEAARIREEMARQEAAMQAEMTTTDVMVTQLAQGILLSIQSGQMTKNQASLMLNGAMLTAEQKTKVREILALKGVQLAK